MRVGPVTGANRQRRDSARQGSSSFGTGATWDGSGAQAVARSRAPSGAGRRLFIGARYLCDYSYAIVPR